MISFVKGTLSAVFDGKVEVDTGMMGFGIFVPVTVMDVLPPIGEEVKLYTYLNVKEDEMSLYGFASRDELSMFKLLITVNGIGPKAGLAILSTMTTSDLRFAIISEDAKSISKAPGVGAKTAQRICIELKDKVSLEDGLEHLNDSPQVAVSSKEDNQEKSDAVMALTALGYSSSEALKAVSKIDVTGKTSDQILKEALKYLF